MPIKSPHEMFENASKKHFALGAFNVSSLESIQAVIGASENLQAPVIIQVSMGARKYVGNLKAFCNLIKTYAEASNAQILLQHDHCTTLEACIEAIDAGVQAVMFDGSALPFEENVAKTEEIVDYAHKNGIWVEAELGRIPGFEDMVFSGHVELTSPEKAKEFIRKTGCDALAISVGTAHGGVVSDKYLTIYFDVLGKILEDNPSFPFVLHGGASLPPELIDRCNEAGGNVPYLKMCSESDINKAVKMGVRKVNMDVDNFLVFTSAIREFFIKHPEAYDPRKYLAPARTAFQNEVEHKIKHVLESEGKAI